MSYKDLQKKIGYKFKDISLLEKALTLSSYDCDSNNEAMETLGDAIIDFLVAERLYNEGGDDHVITDRRKAIVSDKALTPISKNLGLPELLKRGKGDNNNKKSIPSAYEALICAVYLDGGMDKAKQVVDRTLDFRLKREHDYVSILKEYYEKRHEPQPKIVKTQDEDGWGAKIVIADHVYHCTGYATVAAAKQAVAKCAYDEIVREK